MRPAAALIPRLSRLSSAIRYTSHNHWHPTRYTLSRRMSSTSETPAVLASRTVLANIDLSNYDPEQSRLMDERCILVDEQDRALGAADKKTCMSALTL